VVRSHSSPLERISKPMSRKTSLTRRQFLLQSGGALAAAGTGIFVGNHLFANPVEIAAKIESAPQSHPLVPALREGTAALEALTNVKNYVANFIKKELVGRKFIEHQMAMKLREEPFSVYLKFLKPHTGREVLYVDGQNKNMLKVCDVSFAASLVGTLDLDPKGSYAMDENRHPITEIGMRFMAATVLEQWLAETKIQGLTVNFYPNARIGERSCKAIESTHSDPRLGGKYQMTRLYIDEGTGFPVRAQQYGWPSRPNGRPPLIEDYLYTNVQTNVDLTDMDFNPKNPQYRF